MPQGNSSRRGLINVALNGLVSNGVIAGFKTNYATKEEPDQLQIRVTSPSGAPEKSIRAKVLQALGEVGEGAKSSSSLAADSLLGDEAVAASFCSPALAVKNPDYERLCPSAYRSQSRWSRIRTPRDTTLSSLSSLKSSG